MRDGVFTTLAAELRQASRRLWSSRVFAVLAVGILAIGIGTNAAMLALIDALLFRPPQHIASRDVVRLQLRVPGELTGQTRTHYVDFGALRESHAFAAVAASADAFVSIGAGADAVLANALLVSHEFFEVLQPTPHLGSLSVAGEDERDGGDWAVVSYGLWLRHFGGRPDAIGSKLDIDGQLYTVAGVLPKGFPSLSARQVDVWLPLAHTPVAGSIPRNWREEADRSWLSIVARLADGSTRMEAQHRATSALVSRHAALGDREAPTEVVLSSIVPGRDGGESLQNRVSFWLAGVSALLLLIACANVSNLVLTRALAQRREYFIRVALGASRWDLVRRHLADTFVIVVPGALGALGVSFLLRNTSAGLLPGDVPVPRELWDGRTIAIMCGSATMAFMCVHAASLLVVRQSAHGAVSLVAATNARQVRLGVRRVLLAVQAGFCVALLFVAGLFAMSLQRVASLDLGAELDRTIQLTINIHPQRRVAAETQAIYERALDVLRKHPDVAGAALAEGSPYMSGRGIGPRTADRSFDELWTNGREVAYGSAVGAGFFSTVGSHSLRGRDFTAADRIGAPLVAIINAPLARYLWPSAEAIGQCMWVDDEPACVRVVGVLGGVWKFRAVERDRMAVYLPLAQVADALPGALFVQPKNDARTFLPQALAIVQNLRADLPAARGVVLRDVVDPEFRPWRIGTVVFTAVAAVALMISAIGLYGLVAANVMLRLKEIGIRLALGASRRNIVAVVVGESLATVAAGLLGGAGLIVVASRWLTGVLFQTSSNDVVVITQTTLILLMVTAAAVSAPVMRALRTDPARVLRLE